jgi:hypothetical protein
VSPGNLVDAISELSFKFLQQYSKRCRGNKNILNPGKCSTGVQPSNARSIGNTQKSNMQNENSKCLKATIEIEASISFT